MKDFSNILDKHLEKRLKYKDYRVVDRHNGNSVVSFIQPGYETDKAYDISYTVVINKSDGKDFYKRLHINFKGDIEKLKNDLGKAGVNGINIFTRTLPLGYDFRSWKTNSFKAQELEGIQLDNINMMGTKMSYKILGNVISPKDESYNKCVVDFIWERIQDCEKFKTMTYKTLLREINSVKKYPEKEGYCTNDIIEWVMKYHRSYVSIYALSPTLNVFKKYVSESNKCIITYIVNNNHCYGVDNDQWSKSIIKRQGINLDKIIYDNVFDQFIYTDDKDKLIAGKFDYSVVYTSLDILDLVTEVSKKTIVVSMSFYNSELTKFIHPDTGVVICKCDDYEQRKKAVELFDKTHELPLYNYVWTNQSYAQIGSAVLDTIGRVPPSYYNDEVHKMITSFSTVSIVQTINEPRDKHQAIGIDIRKCHSKILEDNKHKIPVYSIFNDIKPFTEPIKCGEYFINPCTIIGGIQLNRMMISAFLGNYLLDKGYIKPSDIVYVIEADTVISPKVFREFKKKVFDTVDESTAKSIVNSTIGKLGQRFRKDTKGFVTSSDEIATGSYFHYSEQPGTKCVIDEANDLFFVTVHKIDRKRSDHSSVYRHVISGSILKVIKLLEQVSTKNSILHSVNTDCIYISNANTKDLDESVYRVEKFKSINRTYHERDQIYENYRHLVPDETKFNVLEKPPTKLTSYVCTGMPGSGKTTLASKQINGLTSTVTRNIKGTIKECKKYEYIGLCFTNKAVNNLIESGVPNVMTFDRFFSRSKRDQIIESFKYKLLIVDEYSMISTYWMSVLYQLKKKHPQLCIQFYGDPFQCGAVDTEYSRVNYLEKNVFKELCGYNMIELKYIEGTSRYGKETLAVLLELLETKKLSTILKKNVTDKEIDDNITKTLDKVKTINAKYELKSGAKVLCKVNRKLKDDRVANSQFFIVDKVNDDLSITLKDNSIVLKSNEYDLGNASTVYKRQGETIRNPFKIHEIEKMDLNEVYTAISRTTKLSDVHLDKFTDKTFNHALENIRTKVIKPTNQLRYGYIYNIIDKKQNLLYIGSTTVGKKERLKQHLKDTDSVVYEHNKGNWKIHLKYAIPMHEHDSDFFLRHYEHKCIEHYSGEYELLNKRGTNEKERVSQKVVTFEENVRKMKTPDELIPIKRRKNGDYYINHTREGKAYRKQSKNIDKVTAFRDEVLKELYNIKIEDVVLNHPEPVEEEVRTHEIEYDSSEEDF